MTPKQKLQKDRAYFKYVISGLPKPINFDSLAEVEALKWSEILSLRDSLIADFEFHSRNFGLKVPEFRCWCGKEGKYTPEHDISYSGCTKVCKKHIKNE